MTDKQTIIDGNKINPNDWLEPYKPIPACEIKDCDHLVYAGNNVYGCRIAEDGLGCDDFNNDDECCMYRQLEYYKETLKAKEQENKDLREDIKDIANLLDLDTGEEYNFGNIELEIKQLKAKEQECEELKKDYTTAKSMYDLCQSDFMKLAEIKDKYKQALKEIKEIAKGCQYGDCHECKYQSRTDCRTELIIQILQKCEVIDE